MPRLTVRDIANLKPGAWITVDTGLQIRVAKDGTKTWIVQYVVRGLQREFRLSRPWGLKTNEAYVSLQDAVFEAQKIRTLARQGVDYREYLSALEQEKNRLQAQEAAENEAKRIQLEIECLTFAELFETWIKDGVRRKDDNAELKRLFNKDILPFVGSVPVKNLTEQQLRAVFRQLVERGVNRTAVVAHDAVTQMFGWAEKRQPWRRLLLDGNPIELIKIEEIVSPEYDINNERTRVLSDDEIQELHSIIETTKAEYEVAGNKRSAVRPIAATTEIGIWIMLSTLCRVGEMCKARWENIDFDRSEWFIPAEDTKGKKGKKNSLMVYLSDFALEKFKSLHAITGESEWCFPATQKSGHVGEKSITKQVGDRQVMFKHDRYGNPRSTLKGRCLAGNMLVLSGGSNGDWTPHDLRRTGATMMQKLGVNLDVIDRCQNHVLKGSKVRRHYLHHEYADEKRDAWWRLGNRLSLLINKPHNVELLKRLA